MRILHTADWHLADRLGHIDRTHDLQRAVERVADICKTEAVDVLLIAGDLFSDLARPAALRDSVEHLVKTFGSFLRDGGTIVAITGNHDRDVFCDTLNQAFRLASPQGVGVGELAPAGRLYLHAGPTVFRLADRSGQQVQFVSLPFPTGDRYLKGERRHYTSLQERHRQLSEAVHQQLAGIQQAYLKPGMPAVLSAHLTVDGALVRRLFRMTENEDMVFQPNRLAADFTYVALGHIHQPQLIGDRSNMRYSGSIERLDQGEREDSKSVTLFEIQNGQLVGEPRELTLDATPFHQLTIENFRTEFPTFQDRFPDAGRALVKYELIYEPGEENLAEMRTALEQFFPRWYSRLHTPRQSQTTGAVWTPDEQTAASPAAVVREYLRRQLAESDPDRGELLQLVEELLEGQT